MHKSLGGGPPTDLHRKPQAYSTLYNELMLDRSYPCPYLKTMQTIEQVVHISASPCFSLVRMSSSMVANCGLNLSKIRPASFGPRSYFSEDCIGNCSCCSRAQCSRRPPLSSSFSSKIRRKGSVEGTSDGKRLYLGSLEGHTRLAMVTGEPPTPCDSCNGSGWLVCGFCEGQKVNVQGKNSRIYRRCPSCRTAGVVICPRCKVFKCVSFPDEKDTGIAL